MTSGSTACHVVIVVPQGTHRPEPLAAAVAHHHPEWVCAPVWAGDPQMRPALDGLAWADHDHPLGEVAWEHLLAASDQEVAGWRRALPVVEQLLQDGVPQVLVLVAGAVAVHQPIHALVPDGDEPAVVVPRFLAPPPPDGLHPDVVDLQHSGACSADAISFAAVGAPMVAWLAAAIEMMPERPLGQLVDLAAGLFGARRCTDPAIGVGRWRWDAVTPALLDVPEYRLDSPWTLDAATLQQARVGLAEVPERRAALDAVSDQLVGERQPVCAPGGLSLDAITRRLVAASDQPLAPWSRPPEFRDWLAARYWTAVHRERADLRTAFADPDGADRDRFDRWCRTATLDDGAPLLLDIPARHQRALPVASTLRHDGLNLVGYLTRDFSLGDVARRLLDALSQADVPVSTIAHQRTQSPVMANPPRIDDEVRFATTLAVVTADQFSTLSLDLGPVVHATERMVGYWFWELEHVPRHMRDVAAMVDQVWAGSRFVTEALAAALPCPVHHVPIPVPQPETSGRARASFPPLADSLDRFAFAVVFDHLSVTERKNPVGVIEAFRRAFAPGEGPLLVVKSMNAEQRWPQHERVRLAAGDRSDIVLWDEHLSRSDQMAFLQAVDCLVSLHRSEGLGLHLAEAMWLGTPVIATRYSGNLDLMDDDCALLIDASLVPVDGGEGVYPPEAFWADPDLDAAAAAMRRVVGDRALADHLREAGRRRMLAQPSLADTGRHIAELLGIDPSAPAR